MKYIIQNCPAYIHRPLSTHDRVCLLGDKVKPNHKELYVYCKDCTDCVMKQIVERCRNEQKYHKKWQKETGFNYAATGLRLANEILQLLDIQEVE